jgi:hypothetical protein
MTKTPTPQAVSAFLRKAGFEKAVMTNNSRHHKEHTGGFHARKNPGGVIVAHWTQTVPMSARTREFVERERSQERVMLMRYAGALESSDWAIDLTTYGLVVTAKEESQ